MALIPEVAKDYGLLKNYINGEWVNSNSDKVENVVNPATGATIAKMPLSTRDEVDHAIKIAQEAWWSWRETPPITRVRMMFKIKGILEEHYEEIARITVQENGKTIDEARGETRRAIENVEVATGMTTLQMGYALEDGAGFGIDEEAIRQPLGVFACINPFNFPSMIPFWFWPYAVATGNTYIIKPSRQVPITMQYIFNLIDQAGFPPGVINLVNGSREVADILMEHTGIKGISFVGSTPVAKHVYRKCAENGKRVQAQGGAKNCHLVLDDATIDGTVANMISACFGCAGQRCLAGSNILATPGIYDRLRERLLDRTSRLKVGYGLDESVNMGPVISPSAKKKIIEYIDGALREGAKPILDGRGLTVNGYPADSFLGPTILEQVTPGMTIAREEVFGPVIALLKVKDLEEGLEIINSSNFGNAATIYTQSGPAAREFKYRAQAGNIGINVGLPAPMAYFPFGGYKDSFFGDLHAQGQDALNFFTERKVVITRWF